MGIVDDEFECPDDGGVLVFVKIIGRYAIYRCVHCDGLERKLVEDSKQKEAEEGTIALPTL